jgi:hypothetical protein
LASTGGKERETRTQWYFELRCELNGLSNLNYAICGRIIQEKLKMEDENGWKGLEEHLLARIARAGLSNLHGQWLRDVCECVLNCVNQIGLREDFGGQSRGHMRG